MERRDELPPGLLASAEPVRAARTRGGSDHPAHRGRARGGEARADEPLPHLAAWARWRLGLAVWAVAGLAAFLAVVAVVDGAAMLVGAAGCGVAALVLHEGARSVPPPGTATRRTMRRTSLRLAVAVPLALLCLLAGVAGTVALRG